MVTVNGRIPFTLPTNPNAIDVDEDKHAHINAWFPAPPAGGAPALPWTFSHNIGEGAATEAMINLCLLAHVTGLELTVNLDTGGGGNPKITKVIIQ